MSVPRPWPSRRPIWQLAFGLVGLLVAVLWLVGLSTHSNGNGFRLFMVVVWTGLGLTWIVIWRRAVKQHSTSGAASENSESAGQ